MRTPTQRRLGLKWRRYVLLAVGAFCVGLAASHASAQTCPGIPVRQCRSTAAEGGALLHNLNSNGHRVWTTRCGPNTFPSHLDAICDELSRCPAAGGFGRFLHAVTGGCRSKHFSGYFGLDGMTFGVLDWTEDNLPALLQAYQRRSPDSFAQTIGGLGLPVENGCLDPRWACESNRQGRLMCDARFHGAFTEALRTAEFRQAQVTEALRAYEQRARRFESLGLQTEYGNVAMAVVANNLVNSPACRPAAWKAACAGQPDERRLVDCMLDRYVANECRGSRRGSESRRDDIRAAFSTSVAEAGVVHPGPDAVIACSADWVR